MTERDQIRALEADLTRLIQRYIDEYDLTVASAVGVLQVKIVELSTNALNQDDDP